MKRWTVDYDLTEKDGRTYKCLNCDIDADEAETIREALELAEKNIADPMRKLGHTVRIYSISETREGDGEA